MQSVEALAELDIPGMDNFLTADSRKETTAAPKQQFFIKQRGQKTSMAGKYDAKAFDQKLIDRALHLVLDYQKLYQFAVIKCQARPFMRKAADLQEEVMNSGLDPTKEPRSF